ACVLVDLNSDGVLDMATANLNSTASVWLGLGGGAFGAKVDLATGSGSSWIESGDLDGDGDQDLAVANASVDSVSILLGNGAGGFAPKKDVSTGDNPSCVAVGNLNGDAVPYLIFT